MSKQKYPSKRRRRRSSFKNNPLTPLLVVLGGIVLLIWGAYTLWEKGQNKTVKVPIEVSGSPRLKVDRETVDLGDVKLNKTVNVTFNLANVGDETLRFSEEPIIEVLEGC